MELGILKGVQDMREGIVFASNPVFAEHLLNPSCQPIHRKGSEKVDANTPPILQSKRASAIEEFW
jgi:hypothetical protein